MAETPGNLNQLSTPPLQLEELQIFVLQLSMMFNAGVSLMDALDSLSASRDPKISEVAYELARRLERGERLSTAMGRMPNTFDRFVVSIIRTGEETGTLSLILVELARRLRLSSERRNALKGALTYPLAILSISGCMVCFLVLFMMPRLLPMLVDLGADLPWPTKILWSLVQYGQVAAVLAVLTAAAAVRFARSKHPKAELAKGWILCETPLLGTIQRLSSLAQLCHDFSLLLRCGTDSMKALLLLAEQTKDPGLKRMLQRCREEIRAGKTVAEALESDPAATQLVTAFVQVGEETGRLEYLLGRVGALMDDRADSARQTFIDLFEPLVMFVMGLLVGFVVLACFLPVYQLISVGF